MVIEPTGTTCALNRFRLCLDCISQSYSFQKFDNNYISTFTCSISIEVYSRAKNCSYFCGLLLRVILCKHLSFEQACFGWPHCHLCSCHSSEPILISWPKGKESLCKYNFLHNMSFKALPVWQAKYWMGRFGLCWLSLTGESLLSRMHLGRFAWGFLRKRAGLAVKQSLSQSFSKFQALHIPWQTEPSGRRGDEKVSDSELSHQSGQKNSLRSLSTYFIYPLKHHLPCFCDSLTIQFYR